MEACRLQGFPDWWATGIAIPNPTDAEVDYWAGVFETYRKTTNPKGKPKSRKQIIQWLKNPHSDSAKYQMWGNGVALPNAEHVIGCAKKLILDSI